MLIPRPETEHLVEAALHSLKASTAQRIVDVGTGSGAIAVTIAKEAERTVVASDISIAALQIASKNIAQHQARVSPVACDLLRGFAPRSFDLVVSNPPYVPGADRANMQGEVRDWEPHVALFASDDGLEIYRALIPQAHAVLRPNGRLMMELGYQALPAVREMLQTAWRDIDVIHDLAGWPRVIVASRA